MLNLVMPLGSPSTHLHIYNVSLKKETRYAMKMCFQYVTLVQYIMETNTFLLYQSKKKKKPSRRSFEAYLKSSEGEM